MVGKGIHKCINCNHGEITQKQADMWCDENSQIPGSEQNKLPSSGTMWEFSRENGTTVFSESSNEFLYNTLKPISIPSVTNIHLHIIICSSSSSSAVQYRPEKPVD